MEKKQKIYFLLCYNQNITKNKGGIAMQPIFHDNQKKAIQHNQNPMLVLAGPGSGKTTVIVHRIQYLIDKLGVLPQKILVITFTKAAAEQMKERHQKLSKKQGVVFGTFHSIFFRILRKVYGYHVEQVLQEDEKKSMLRKLMANLHIETQDEEEYIQQFSGQLSLMKNELLTFSDFQPEGLPKEEFQTLANAFASEKRRNEKIDFDDMLTECYALLQNEVKERRYWQQKFDYILVDEFQDVNAAQYACLKLLAEAKQNVFVVGDDDQSIYGFRGARPEFMLEFPKDYPNSEKVVLDVNYRSTDRIIRLAERVIGGNTYRYQKNIKGNRDIGDKIKVFTTEDTTEEAEEVAKRIGALLAHGIPLEEIAVIYRTNIQGGAFARALYRKGIPYHIKDGGLNIYTHWIAKDLQAYLYLAENPNSDQALLRIANKPKRYISKALLAEAKQMPYGLLRSLHVCPSLQKWQVEQLERLEIDLIQIKRRKPYEALRYIRNVVGYDEYLADYAIYRKANLPSMLEIADEITETAKGIEDFLMFGQRLEEMSIQMKEQSKTTRNHQKAVTLTTFHSAKGLEFEAVFLPSMAEGVLPYEKSKEGLLLEEERRLCYVGITRTKDRLYISFAKNRYDKPAKPSRFLKEMGLDMSVLIQKNKGKI